MHEQTTGKRRSADGKKSDDPIVQFARWIVARSAERRSGTAIERDESLNKDVSPIHKEANEQRERNKKNRDRRAIVGEQRSATETRSKIVANRKKKKKKSQPPRGEKTRGTLRSMMLLGKKKMKKKNDWGGYRMSLSMADTPRSERHEGKRLFNNAD